jgi:hypothetical protein
MDSRQELQLGNTCGLPEGVSSTRRWIQALDFDALAAGARDNEARNLVSLLYHFYIRAGGVGLEWGHPKSVCGRGLG